MNTRPQCKWILRSVLIAGRRLDGESTAADPVTAVRHFAARKAKELKVDVSTAIATAVQDPYKKVEASTEPTGP